MGATAGIVLDSLNGVRACEPAVEVDRSYPPLGTTSAMPYGDLAGTITTTLAHALLREGQGEKWPAFP